jgi:hypothetical protein
VVRLVELLVELLELPPRGQERVEVGALAAPVLGGAQHRGAVRADQLVDRRRRGVDRGVLGRRGDARRVRALEQLADGHELAAAGRSRSRSATV